MNTKPHVINISGMAVEIARKPIKNLHLGVYPPHGRIRVAAPLAFNDDSVRLAVINKLGWIKRQRAKFESQSRQSLRAMINGESHYFLGQRYRLRIIEEPGANKIKIHKKAFIHLYVPASSSAKQRERILLSWYRDQLRTAAFPLIEKWQKILKVELTTWGIRKMKTKWGSCNADASRLWLNLELAKKPVQCLEYIIFHEMAHLLERRHNDRFISMMDKHMPIWRSYRDELNSTPLGYELWNC